MTAPLAINATYASDLARVQLDVTGFPAGTDHTSIERFHTATLTNSTLVRGGTATGINPATMTSLPTVSDYEFETDGQLTYKVTAYNSVGAVVSTATATITPALSVIWFKSVPRPFLNSPFTVVDFSDVSRGGRGSALQVLNRSLPVAVTEVRGSAQYTLSVRTATRDERKQLELFLAFGDVLFLHVPGDCDVPGGYFLVGDVSERRRGAHDAPSRWFDLPLVQVSAPDPSIIGYTVTWAGIVSGFATWADVVTAFPTWLDVTEYVSAASDEIVS